MGVISTPPRPAAANCSSCRVRPARSTALPGHHQRVQGRAVRVISGQGPADGGAASAGTPQNNTTLQIHAFIATPSAAAPLSTRGDFDAIAFGVAHDEFVIAITG